jgi:hypothetical protein
MENIVGGDSGAWIIDNEQGRVCGHVLAWCSRNSIAYFCPMEVLLEDIKRHLPATTVELPGAAPIIETSVPMPKEEVVDSTVVKSLEQGLSTLNITTPLKLGDIQTTTVELPTTNESLVESMEGLAINKEEQSPSLTSSPNTLINTASFPLPPSRTTSQKQHRIVPAGDSLNSPAAIAMAASRERIQLGGAGARSGGREVMV